MNILVLAPHTDDGELGCGASIAKYIEEGHTVFYAAFSTASQSLRPEFESDQLVKEVKEATGILGIAPENLIIFNYEVRKLNYHRQDILDDMMELSRRIEPDIVFLPSTRDIHQDHITITQEGIRAFKYCTLFGYELIWNNISLDTDCFNPIKEEHLSLKINALYAYKTQQYRPYMNESFIRSLSSVRGVQAGVEYAEAFEAIRIIMNKF